MQPIDQLWWKHYFSLLLKCTWNKNIKDINNLYEEDDNYFEDGYHRNPSDIFKTPVDLKFDTDIYGVDLDVVLKSGEKIKAYWHLEWGSGNKTLKGRITILPPCITIQ